MAAQNSTEGSGDIRHKLGLDRPPDHRKRRWYWGIGLVTLALMGMVFTFWVGEEGRGPQFVTATARQGDLVVRVIATGTLQPVNQVEVGTEVSGTIKTVEVDYNDRVHAGQILARLDTDQLEAKYRQSEAALVLAKARVKEAQATVIETRNQRRRTQALLDKGLTSPELFDAAEAGYARAEASLGVAQAQVGQAQAQLDADQRMLEKAIIRSPIDGIVLQRQVEPGQTVAASLQTPVLFTLAEDLTQMALHVAVDEADVSQVQEGQRALFVVAAYSGQTFPAVIDQVRFAPQTVEGVVTYEALLAVDNAALLLRPGMTATAEIIVQQLQDVLLVPNAALRFTPVERPAEGGRGAEGGLLSKLLPRPPRTPRRSEPEREEGLDRQVWVLREGRPVAIPVTAGATDGLMTQIVDGSPVRPGMALLVDRERAGI